jgi:hypothetical protein
MCGVYAPRATSVEAGTQKLHVGVACWVGTVSGFPGGKMLFGVHVQVAKHSLAVDAIVGSVETMHVAVKATLGRFRFWIAYVGVRSCG